LENKDPELEQQLNQPEGIEPAIEGKNDDPLEGQLKEQAGINEPGFDKK